MKLTAIITTLVLGSSSVALADPIYRDRTPYSDRYDARDYYDARRGYDDMRARSARRGVLLANDVRLSESRWNRRPAFIAIDPRMTRFNNIMLRASNSRTYISAVVLMFRDGRRETLQINREISGRDPFLLIDLPNRGVTGMYVYGRNVVGAGAFDVLAVRDRGDRGVVGRRAPYRRF